MHPPRLYATSYSTVSIRFPCGCRAEVNHERETGKYEYFLRPCGPPTCTVLQFLRQSLLDLCNLNGSVSLKPSTPGPP